jgi:circadian clock protein KaiC
LSAISRTGALSSARAIGNRLLYKLRDHHITAVITALVEGEDPQAESTELQISTIADSWIQLSYLVCGGERNRALTIVKSRGTHHSNQVRELVISDAGLALVEGYFSGGEVLMGTLRWEKEAEQGASKARQQAEFAQKRRGLQFAEASTRAQITALRMDLQRQRAELTSNAGEDDARAISSSEREGELRRRRSADPPRPSSRKRGNGAAR